MTPARVDRRAARSFASATVLETGLDAIARDHRSGATELSRKLLRALGRARPARGAGTDYARALIALCRAGERLCPGMPAVGVVARDVLREFRAQDGHATTDTDRQWRAWTRAVEIVREQLTSARARASERFREHFRDVRRPLTLSFSSAVLDAIAPDDTRTAVRTVTVCESRPGREGRELARRLRKRSAVGVVFVTEAQCALAMEECDAVVLGCDALFSDGSVSNKVGSRVVATVARHASRRVIVLADHYKFASRRQFDAGDRSAAAVWRTPPRGVRVCNPTFEVVPPALIDYIVLEDGVYRPRQVRAQWRRKRS